MAQVATRMGWGYAFNYAHQAEIHAEYAAMTRFEDQGDRVLSLPRHCEEHTDAAIQTGLLRCARNDRDYSAREARQSVK